MCTTFTHWTYIFVKALILLFSPEEWRPLAQQRLCGDAQCGSYIGMHDQKHAVILAMCCLQGVVLHLLGTKASDAETEGTKAHQKACNLYCNLLQDSQNVLACEGGCNTNVHRCCAGATRHHYSKLTMGTNPFVCQFCALETYGALVKQLQSGSRGSSLS